MASLSTAARSLNYATKVITEELNKMYFATDVRDPMSNLLVHMVAFTCAVGAFADEVERSEV